MKYKETLDRSKEFYDTIDFTPFFTSPIMDVDNLMDKIADYYELQHPELIPEDFKNCFFNFMDKYEFAVYLKLRYNMDMTDEVIEKYYLYQ